MPNSGHSELMPPRGSITPCQRKCPHIATIIALERTTAGVQLERPNDGHTWRPRSWSMKRPTRVPASSVVRMNSASNMMAK